MEDLPTFPYHPDPVATGSVEPSNATCLCCGRRRGFVYVGGVYSTHELDGALCPWCIADGSAAERFAATFNGADAEAPDDVPAATVALVATRTPGFATWQDPEWRFHCGDAAAFLGTLDAGGSDSTIYRFRCRHCGAELTYADAL